MAVVGCSILCSKFAKNRLSAWLCPYPLGELTALPSWIKGEGRGKGRWKGRRGRGGKGRGEEGREWVSPPNEHPGYGPASNRG